MNVEHRYRVTKKPKATKHKFNLSLFDSRRDWPVWTPDSLSCGCPDLERSGSTERAPGCSLWTALPPSHRLLLSTGYGTGRWTWTDILVPGVECWTGRHKGTRQVIFWVPWQKTRTDGGLKFTFETSKTLAWQQYHMAPNITWKCCT